MSLQAFLAASVPWAPCQGTLCLLCPAPALHGTALPPAVTPCWCFAGCTLPVLWDVAEDVVLNLTVLLIIQSQKKDLSRKIRVIGGSREIQGKGGGGKN